MTTTTRTVPTTRSCRWIDGKDIARNAIDCGSSAVLKVQIDEEVSYYRVGRSNEDGVWIVGKEAPDGGEPKFYFVTLGWTKTDCECDSCLWGRRKQFKQARVTGVPVQELFQCKHILFLQSALAAIGLI